MFIRMHLAQDSREIWIRAIDVRSIEKAPQGPKGEIQLGSVIATNLMTSSGPFGYHVKEDPQELAQAVADVLSDKTGQILDPPASPGKLIAEPKYRSDSSSRV